MRRHLTIADAFPCACELEPGEKRGKIVHMTFQRGIRGHRYHGITCSCSGRMGPLEYFPTLHEAVERWNVESSTRQLGVKIA